MNRLTPNELHSIVKLYLELSHVDASNMTPVEFLYKNAFCYDKTRKANEQYKPGVPLRKDQ